MKKIKRLFVALLACICCLALSSCELIWTGFYLTAGLVDWALDEDRNAPTDEELRMVVEITEGVQIVEITQDEEGFYLVKTVGAIKSLGNKDSDRLSYRLSYYDVHGYLLDTLQIYDYYVGAGDTYKIEYEARLYYEPTTARIYDVQLYETYDYAEEKKSKEEVEILGGENFVCALGEDGLYHATVTGQVKLLSESDEYVYVRVAFYDANGYLYVEQWSKRVLGLAERTYTVECISETEILSYKVVYGATSYSIIY